MKVFVLAAMVLLGLGLGLGLGISHAFADCNPWVKQCLTFRMVSTAPLLDGARAGHQKCHHLGCGW